MPDPDEDAETLEDFTIPESYYRERRRALAEAGPNWRTWTFQTGLKPYLILLFVIVDAWIVLSWVAVGSWAGLVVSLVAAAYLEFLLYRYLWTRPSPEEPRPFRRSFSRPVWAGRWTPEGDRIRAGEQLPATDESRKREEFL